MVLPGRAQTGLFILLLLCIISLLVIQEPLQKGISAAAALVVLSVLYLYQPKPAPPIAQRVPVEDFSIWVDIGEPLSKLSQVEPGQLLLAGRLVKEDMKLLCSNLDLLDSRLKMMSGRFGELEGIGELAFEVKRRLELLGSDFPSNPSVLRERKKDMLTVLEYSEMDMKYAHEKLVFLLSSQPIEQTYMLEQLERQVRRMEEGIRQARRNLSAFLEKFPTLETSSPTPEAPPSAQQSATQAS